MKKLTKSEKLDLVKGYENLIRKAISKYVEDLPWQEGIDLDEDGENELLSKFKLENFPEGFAVGDDFFGEAEKNVVAEIHRVLKAK